MLNHLEAVRLSIHLFMFKATHSNFRCFCCCCCLFYQSDASCSFWWSLSSILYSYTQTQVDQECVRSLGSLWSPLCLCAASTKHMVSTSHILRQVEQLSLLTHIPQRSPTSSIILLVMGLFITPFLTAVTKRPIFSG